MRIHILVAVCLCCVPMSLIYAQEKPRPDLDRKGGRPPERGGKADKWRNGQQKDKFNRAASGNTARDAKERDDRNSGSGARVEKADKWARGQYKDKFNRAANPPDPPPSGSGTPKKSGGGGSSPPSAPAAKAAPRR